MNAYVGETRTVLRSCEGQLIPMGTKVTIPKGSQVVITQALGGSFTVNVNGNLVRVDAGDADALGLETEARNEAPQVAEGPVDEAQVWAALKACYDPEIPVNIVDLGLVYDCVITPLEKGNRVDVRMTLTAPGCGMGPFIDEDARSKILAVPNVTDVQIDLVFDPPWDRAMMSEEAKLQLGMF